MDEKNRKGREEPGSGDDHDQSPLATDSSVDDYRGIGVDGGGPAEALCALPAAA